MDKFKGKIYKRPTKVSKYVGLEKPSKPFLPLTHVTNLHGFRAIAVGTHMVPGWCRIFEEDLLYFFYGRPAYRAANKSASKLLWNVPMAFIIQPNAVTSVKRVVPFDSGAFAKKRYGRVFSPEADIGDFLLPPKIESAGQYVSAFFGDNAGYVTGRTNIEHDLGNFEFELQGLEQLSKSSVPFSHDGNDEPKDERSSAVEIQVDVPLGIEKSIIKIIVPDVIVDEKIFVDAMHRWKIPADKISIYDNVIGPGPEAWIGQLYSKVIDIYRDLGIMK